MRYNINFKQFVTLSAMISVMIFMLGSCSQQAPKNSRVAQSERGKFLFDEHCSSCHGDNKDVARVDTLDITPPDLSLIKARRKVSNFPIVEMARMIDGRSLVKIHGDRAMPVWGEIFANAGDDEESIRTKKGELVAYLMSIQK